VLVPPSGVVTVYESGLGMWRVAVEPPEVLTSTEVELTGTVVVTVPPFEVTTWLTVGLEATVTQVVSPDELMTGTEVTGVDGTDGELTKLELGMEVTVCPYWVMTGELVPGARMVSVEPDGVVMVSETGLGR
jgi:hypothetical protein